MASSGPTLKSLEEGDFMGFKTKLMAYEIAAGIHKKNRSLVGFFDECFI
jgi:hypothetical protein